MGYRPFGYPTALLVGNTCTTICTNVITNGQTFTPDLESITLNVINYITLTFNTLNIQLEILIIQ